MIAARGLMTTHAHRTRRAIGFAWLALVSTCKPSEPNGCLADPSPSCRPPTACGGLVFQCNARTARAFRITSLTQRLGGLDAVGTVGDYVLQNDRVTAVIDDPADPEHRHGIHPSGGTLIDLAPNDHPIDHLNQISQVTGILPRDALFYDRAEMVIEGDSASVIVRGHLAGNPLDGSDRVEVVTRYEMRACDPGVRVRTELYNGGRRVLSAYLADAMFWGDRGVTPFAPRENGGFHHNRLDLLHLDQSFERFPWVAAQSHVNDGAGETAYALVSCVNPRFQGLNDPTLSTAGRPPDIIVPGDGRAIERFIAVARGPGLANVASLAIEAHAQLFNETFTHLAGSVRTPEGTPLGASERAVSLVISTRDDSGTETPWTEVVPDVLGSFVATVPTASRWVIQPWRSGRKIGAPRMVTDPTQRVAVTLPAPARVVVRVTDAVTGRPTDAEVILVPTGDTSGAQVRGSLYGFFDHEDCAPYHRSTARSLAGMQPRVGLLRRRRALGRTARNVLGLRAGRPDAHARPPTVDRDRSFDEHGEPLAARAARDLSHGLAQRGFSRAWRAEL